MHPFRQFPRYLILAAFALSCSGTQVAPKVAEAIDVAECQLAAVEALVPHLPTAEAVVTAARAGDFERAARLLLQLGLSSGEISAVANAFNACWPRHEIAKHVLEQN